jgi:SpoVK/Ycf46/Vps4 family AAA+-type ATPase
MRTGFACLFSGPPGTGKTETAYQIARETGRDLLMVNIAETKSMWFGESEKRIKALFDRYRVAAAGGGLAPILLFNEADAVISKRKELGVSSRAVDQTENAIQNIILQEIENLNGILIATSNLTRNMDRAFERRFLYKIEFAKPNIASRMAIWRSLIPVMSEEDARVLSTRFDFSGGQVENIARKRTVSYVISGAEPSLDMLIDFCEHESLTGTDSGKIIGFAQ